LGVLMHTQLYLFGDSVIYSTMVARSLVGFFSGPTPAPWTFDMYLVLFVVFSVPLWWHLSLHLFCCIHFLSHSLLLSWNFIFCCDMYTACNWRRGRNSDIDYVFLIILSSPDMKVKKPSVSSSTIMLMVVQGILVLVDGTSQSSSQCWDFCAAFLISRRRSCCKSQQWYVLINTWYSSICTAFSCLPKV
jgi:hypothetical protein